MTPRFVVLVLVLLFNLCFLVLGGKTTADIRFCQAPNCGGFGAASVEAVQNPPAQHEVEMVPKTGSIAVDKTFCATSCEVSG